MARKGKKTKVSGWKPISRRVFKKEKVATVVYKGSTPNRHFKEEYEQQGAFLSWR